DRDGVADEGGDEGGEDEGHGAVAERSRIYLAHSEAGAFPFSACGRRWPGQAGTDGGASGISGQREQSATGNVARPLTPTLSRKGRGGGLAPHAACFAPKVGSSSPLA